MTLDRPVVLGIICGLLIGGVYIALQRRELRSEIKSIQPRSPVELATWAIARLVFLVVAWWLVFEFTDADKYWLTGALVVAYTVPFLVQLRELVVPKK